MKKLILIAGILFAVSGLQANDKYEKNLSNKLNLTQVQKEQLKKEHKLFKKKVEKARAEMFGNLNLSETQKSTLKEIESKNQERRMKMKEKIKQRVQERLEEDSEK